MYHDIKHFDLKMDLESTKDEYVNTFDDPLIFINHNDCLKELF